MRGFLLGFTQELSQIAHEQFARVQIAPSHPFCDVDGDIELYSCAVTSVTVRQGGLSRLFLYTCRKFSRQGCISLLAEVG